MTRIQFFSLVLTTAATVSFAHAGTDYRCTVERIFDADGDNSQQINGQRKLYIGKEFTVDRSSGVMMGALKNSYMTKPVVVDRGSKDNSFKAVTTMRSDQGVGAGSTVSTLVVKEYAESPQKPFAFMSNDTVYFGTLCAVLICGRTSDNSAV